MGSPLYDDAVPQPYDTSGYSGYSEQDDEFSCGDPDCFCGDEPDDLDDPGRPIVTIDTGGLL